MSVAFRGAVLVAPGVASYIDDSNASSAGIGQANAIAVLGQAERGEAGIPVLFTDAATVRAYYGRNSGTNNLVAGITRAMSAGASRVYGVRVGYSTAASTPIGSAISVTTQEWGVSANLWSLAIGTGSASTASVPKKKITLTVGDQRTYVVDNVYGQPIKLEYFIGNIPAATGTTATASLVSGTLTLTSTLGSVASVNLTAALSTYNTFDKLIARINQSFNAVTGQGFKASLSASVTDGSVSSLNLDEFSVTTVPTASVIATSSSSNFYFTSNIRAIVNALNGPVFGSFIVATLISTTASGVANGTYNFSGAVDGSPSTWSTTRTVSNALSIGNVYKIADLGISNAIITPSALATYASGTITSSTTAITGSGTTFVSAMVGGLLISEGYSGIITAQSTATSITVDVAPDSALAAASYTITYAASGTPWLTSGTGATGTVTIAHLQTTVVRFPVGTSITVNGFGTSALTGTFDVTASASGSVSYSVTMSQVARKDAIRLDSVAIGALSISSNDGGYCDFTQAGAANNDIGTQFVATGSLPQLAGAAYAATGWTSGVTADNWSTAISALEVLEDVRIIVPMTSSTTIQSAVHGHCLQMSGVTGKRERFGVYGGPTGQSVSAVKNLAASFNDKRAVVVWPGIKDYDDNGDLVTFAPFYLAATVGGILGAQPDVAQPLTNKPIPVRGLEKTAKPNELDDLVSNGVFALKLDSARGYVVTQSLTTWSGDTKFIRREISTMRAADQVLINVRNSLSDLIGEKLSGGLESKIATITEKVLTAAEQSGLIVSNSANAAWKDVTVRTYGDAVLVDFSISPAYPANYILITAHIL